MTNPLRTLSIAESTAAHTHSSMRAPGVPQSRVQPAGYILGGPTALDNHFLGALDFTQTSSTAKPIDVTATVATSVGKCALEEWTSGSLAAAVGHGSHGIITVTYVSQYGVRHVVAARRCAASVRCRIRRAADDLAD